MPTSKKAPAKKKVTAKKTISAKTRKSTSKQAPVHRSFRLAFDKTPFLTFRLTKQTLYWTVLGVVIFFFATWIIHLQLQIQDIYNQIDVNNNTAVMMPRAATK